MSILHNSARREWYLPSYCMSKQANQTRHVAEKGSKLNKGPKTQNTGNPHNSTHPFEGQTGSPSVPRSAPQRDKPPITQGSPATLLSNGVLYASLRSEDSSDRSHPARNPP